MGVEVEKEGRMRVFMGGVDGGGWGCVGNGEMVEGRQGGGLWRGRVGGELSEDLLCWTAGDQRGTRARRWVLLLSP